jgi:hypothetical protein
MTAPYPYQPVPAQPSNGMATAGFITGLIGAVFAPIPFIGIIAWPLVIIGAVLSGLGLVKANQGASGKGLAIAGVVLSACGLLICVLWVTVFAVGVAAAPPAAPYR